MSAVSEGRRVSRDSIRRPVGMGSRGQVLGADLSMIFLTVDSETGSKEQNGTPQNGFISKCWVKTFWESRSLLIFTILLMKNLQKRSGRDDKGNIVGSWTVFVRARMLLTILYNSLEEQAEEILQL